jgi:uncharacterized membrane protein YqjE
MDSESSASGGFMARARDLGDCLIASLQDRLELFAVELQEEKFRLIQVLIWITAAIFTAAMVVLFASLTVVYLFWETARLAALAGLTLFYGAVLVGLLLGFRRYLARQPKPFAATLNELKEDRECIRTDN